MNLIKGVMLCGTLVLSGCYGKSDLDNARKACLDEKGEVSLLANGIGDIYSVRCKVEDVSYRVNRSNKLVEGKVVK